MYPRVDTHIPIHSHLTAAPYISHSDHKAHQSTKTGLTVIVWQDPTDSCAVQAVSFRVKWVTSLGLLVTRYRMTILAWMIGLGSLVVCAQYQQYRRTGKSSPYTRNPRPDLSVRCLSCFPRCNGAFEWETLDGTLVVSRRRLHRASKSALPPCPQSRGLPLRRPGMVLRLAGVSRPWIILLLPPSFSLCHFRLEYGFQAVDGKNSASWRPAVGK